MPEWQDSMNDTKRPTTAETRKKQSDAHSGEKHHYFGVIRSEETKLKITRTLSSITRFDHDAVTTLPPHMKVMNEAGTIGYMIVGHNALPGKCKIKFSSKRSMSNDVILTNLRARCLFYLEHLNACAENSVAPTPKIAFMESFS